MSQLAGLLVNAFTSRLEDAVTLVRDRSWTQVLNKYPVSPEIWELGELFFTRDLYTIQNASKVTPNYSISERQVNSLYGAAEVGYKDLLFLNATVRNDWFSTLSPENRSILYPSITGSWVFSQSFANRD